MSQLIDVGYSKVLFYNYSQAKVSKLKELIKDICIKYEEKPTGFFEII